MSHTQECPRCRGPAAGNGSRNGNGNGNGGGACPRCGAKLIEAASSTEAEVRDYLYGRRLALNRAARALPPAR